MKKKVVYTLPYLTEADIKKAVALRSRLYGKFKSVQVSPQGSYAVIIEASNA